MAISRRKATLLISIILLIGIFILLYLKVFKTDKINVPNNQATATVDDVIRQTSESLIKKSTQEYITNSDVLIINDLIEAKKFSEAITKAQDLCKDLKNEMQRVCYNLHAKALMELGQLPELAKLSEEVLVAESIQQNEDARINWEYMLEQALKGINPKDSPRGGMGTEARE
jgi:hypothetical protein